MLVFLSYCPSSAPLRGQAPSCHTGESPGISREVWPHHRLSCWDFYFHHHSQHRSYCCSLHSSWLSFSGPFFCSSLHFSLYFILFFSADRDKSSSKFTISGFVAKFKVEFYGCGCPGYSTVLMGPNKPGCSGVLLNSGMRGREKASFSPVTCRNPHP